MVAVRLRVVVGHADVERPRDAVALMVREPRPVPLLVKQREGLAEEEADGEAVPLIEVAALRVGLCDTLLLSVSPPDPVGVADWVGFGEREPPSVPLASTVVLTVSVRVVEGQADPVGPLVAEPLIENEYEGVALEQPLPLSVKHGDAEGAALPLGLAGALIDTVKLPVSVGGGVAVRVVPCEGVG